MSGPEARILESTIGISPVSDLVMSSSFVTFDRSRRRREDEECVRTSKVLKGVAVHSDDTTADEICRMGVSNAKDGDPAGLNTIFCDLFGLKREMSKKNMSVQSDMKITVILTQLLAEFTHREHHGKFALGMMTGCDLQQISKKRVESSQTPRFFGVRFQRTP